MEPNLLDQMVEVAENIIYLADAVYNAQEKGEDATKMDEWGILFDEATALAMTVLDLYEKVELTETNQH